MYIITTLIIDCEYKNSYYAVIISQQGGKVADLIVIESPNKIKKLRPLCKGADIVATVGHFKDLPEDDFGIDRSSLDPVFVYSTGKKEIATRLNTECKGKRVYIATDPDREGFGIAMHVFEEVKKGAAEIYRLEIHELTAKGVAEAMKKSVPFLKTNLHLYDAFLGRRIGDRVVGYTLSPIASNELKGRFSVGRVQSPAVRLVVEREREIRAFVSEPYWVVSVLLEKGVQFKAFHVSGNIKDEAEGVRILDLVTAATEAIIEKVEEKTVQQSPKAPFTTVDLQATASGKLGFSPEKTMQLAQALFETALTSYHRTDSARIADEIIAEIRTEVGRSLGKDYLSAVPRIYKSKNSQADAHEAIRPTHIHPLSECAKAVAAEGLTSDHAKLYELIYRRTVASQMSNAVFDTTTVHVDVVGEKFKAKGRVQKFDGFLAVYKEDEAGGKKETPGILGGTSESSGKGSGEDVDDEKDQALPVLTAGEHVRKIGQEADKKATKPPKRYTEGSLVKSLEKAGIGRPSTYASIMKTIKTRGYVDVAKGKLHATPSGETIVDYLLKQHGWAIDFDMTRNMEDQLDDVEEGKADWKTFIRDLLSRMDGYMTGSYVSAGSTVGMGGSAGNPGGIFGPSPKQVALAEKLSKEHGEPIPESVKTDRRELSAWIDSMLKKGGGLSLSPKQIAIVEKNAPPEILAKMKAGDIAVGRAFLDEYFGNMKSQGRGKPPEVGVDVKTAKTGGRKSPGTGKPKGAATRKKSKTPSPIRQGNGATTSTAPAATHQNGTGFVPKEGWGDRPPTEKQVAFLKSLLAGKKGVGPAAIDAMITGWTMRQVSEEINKLKCS